MENVIQDPVIRNRNAKWTDEFRALCVSAYQRGTSISAIAKRYKVSRPTLYRRFKALGILEHRVAVEPKKRERKRKVVLYLTDQSYMFLQRVKNRSAFIDEILAQIVQRQAQLAKASHK